MSDLFLNPDKGILITSDQKRIAYYHLRDGHKQVVVIAPGFYNSKDSELLKAMAKGLSDSFDLFMFDFRGHGTSSGWFTWTSKEDKDLGAVLDFLIGKYEKIAVIGISLGGAVALNLASRKPGIDSLVLISPPSDFNRIDYQFWKLDWQIDIVYTLLGKNGRKGKGVRPGLFWLKKQKPIDLVKELKAPVLYIHGDKDWVIRPWHSQALFDRTKVLKKILIVKNGPHAEYLIKTDQQEVMAAIKDWLRQTLG